MCGSLTKNEMLEILDGRKVNHFIETGTYLGQTTIAASGIFQNIYTVEIDQNLYNNLIYNYRNMYPRIHFLQGDSVDVLPIILGAISEPVFFYLDGHYSGCGTGRGKIDCPLLEELSIIGKRGYADIIVIDDARLFGNEWPDINAQSILSALNKPVEGTFILNDRFIIYTKGVE
jgi:hypothetical protein